MSRRGSSSRPRSTGRSKAAIARSNKTHRSNATLPPVLGLLAVRLLDWADEAGRKGMIHVAASGYSKLILLSADINQLSAAAERVRTFM